MTNREKYQALQRDLRAVEARTGLYLADECIDRQNLSFMFPNGEDESEECYAALYRAAVDAAGFRAEDAGENINELLGRCIY